MSWLKIDDGFVENPKVAELSDRAFRLHMAALCYCARNLTDGLLTVRAVKAMCALTGSFRRHVVELRDAGLWIPLNDEWTIKDYLLYNPDAVSAKAVKDARSAAGKRGADKRWNGGNSDGKGHGKPLMPRPVPSPPVEDPSAVSAAPAFAAPLPEEQRREIAKLADQSLRSVA